jgi:hypothetical protein
MFTKLDIHKELLCNCSIHCIETLNKDNTQIIGNEVVYHKSINSNYDNDDFFEKRGYCNVKCNSVNWPHACDFCVICNIGKKWCKCLNKNNIMDNNK